MNPSTLAPLPARSPSPDMCPPTRREFLQRLGAGLMIWVALDPLYAAEAAAATKKTGGRPAVPTDFNAFLSIGADGTLR